MSEQAAQTPLTELARSVPKDLRAEWEIQWWEDGTPSGHAMAPVGKYLHELADQVDRLTAENNVLRKGIEGVMDRYTEYDDSSEDCCRTMYDRAGLALSIVSGRQES